jgi:hypothetical protein
MKKILLIATAVVFFVSSSYAFGGVPNQKVLAAFNKTFQQVKEVSWQELDNNYEANFTQNNIIYRVSYDLEGNVVKSIRYYYGETLPVYIQAKLSKKYEGKTVFGVTEITSENQVTYYIILQDDKNWINVQSDAFGNMFTEKKLKKA